MTPENLATIAPLIATAGVIILLVDHPLATILGLCLVVIGVVGFLGSMVWDHW